MTWDRDAADFRGLGRGIAQLRPREIHDLISRNKGLLKRYLVRKLGLTRADADEILTQAAARLVEIQYFGSVRDADRLLFTVVRDLAERWAGRLDREGAAGSSEYLIESPAPETSSGAPARVVHTMISGLSAGAVIGSMLVPGAGALYGSLLGGIVGAWLELRECVER